MRYPALSCAAIATAALLLAGCVGGTPDAQETPPPTVTIDEVAVPGPMTPTVPSVSVDQTILPAVDGYPMLIGGSLAEPGKGGAPTVWASKTATNWTPTAVDPDFEGSFSGGIAGTSKLAAVAGVAWKDGESHSVLWTTKDRETWKAVELPADFADTYLITDTAVSDTTVIMVGTDAAGESRGIRVVGKNVNIFDLPKPGKGNQLSASTIVAKGEQLLLLASPGPEGEAADTVAYTSDDLGESWNKPVTVTDKLGYVSGVTLADDGFVATGGAPRDADGTVTGAAAWFSADGSSWAPEAVPAPDEYGDLFYYGSADASLGAPVANAGVTVAILANDNAEQSGVYQRAIGGQWAMVGQTSVNSGNGDGGVALSLDGSTIAGVLGDSGYLRAGVFAGGGWTDDGELAARNDIASVSSVEAIGDRVLATLYTSRFTVDGPRWRTQASYTLGELSGDTLSEVPWDPARAGELSNVQTAVGADGAELVVGSYFPPGAEVILAEAYFRASADAEWTPAVGFEGAGATNFYAVEKIGDLWVAGGQNRASSAVGDPSHGVVWTSADGVNWTKPAGDFGSGPLESGITDVCALPDGTAIAIGWAYESAADYRATVWMPQDGTWTRADIGEIGTKRGQSVSCASGDDGVVMAATISGRDTLQLSTDGKAWTETFRADRGVGIGGPVAVDGGFAASGSLTDESFSGPVVWLSADGTDWKSVSIPSYRPGSTTAVAPYGDDLVVMMGARTGHPVSIVRDIAKIIKG